MITSIVDVSLVSVIILTYNEEMNLPKCLDSVCANTDEVIVIDSFSTDSTCEIAAAHNCTIYKHAYDSHPSQWHWVLENIPLKHDWILAVDADFEITAQLWSEIRRTLSAHNGPTKRGYYVRHLQMFDGKLLRHGSMYPRYWLRLFHRESVSVDEADLVDVHFYVRGEIGRIEADIIENNLKEADLSFWVNKQMRFATRQAKEEYGRRTARGRLPTPAKCFGTPDQHTLFLKELWYRMPLYVRPILFFAYRYIIRAGFLDGKAGYLYHVTQAFLYRLAVDAELDRISSQHRRH